MSIKVFVFNKEELEFLHMLLRDSLAGIRSSVSIHEAAMLESIRRKLHAGATPTHGYRILAVYGDQASLLERITGEYLDSEISGENLAAMKCYQELRRR